MHNRLLNSPPPCSCVSGSKFPWRYNKALTALNKSHLSCPQTLQAYYLMLWRHHVKAGLVDGCSGVVGRVLFCGCTWCTVWACVALWLIPLFTGLMKFNTHKHAGLSASGSFFKKDRTRRVGESSGVRVVSLQVSLLRCRPYCVLPDPPDNKARFQKCVKCVGEYS